MILPCPQVVGPMDHSHWVCQPFCPLRYLESIANIFSGILKDTPVAYSPLYMQRRADLYPPPSSDFPHVLTFCPERWEKWTPKSWTYIPFNGGPRICIGQQFALTEMGYTIVRILQRFEFVSRYWEAEEQKLKSDIVLSPAHGVRVGFWERKSL